MATTAKTVKDLNQTPKYAIRRRNRCRKCGRPRAYLRKFALQNGYPTYAFSSADASVEDGSLHVVLPFPEKGDHWGPLPEVRLHTPQAVRYLEALSGAAPRAR